VHVQEAWPLSDHSSSWFSCCADREAAGERVRIHQGRLCIAHNCFAHSSQPAPRSASVSGHIQGVWVRLEQSVSTTDNCKSPLPLGVGAASSTRDGPWRLPLPASALRLSHSLHVYLQVSPQLEGPPLLRSPLQEQEPAAVTGNVSRQPNPSMVRVGTAGLQSTAAAGGDAGGSLYGTHHSAFRFAFVHAASVGTEAWLLISRMAVQVVGSAQHPMMG
jgi:hypothetical protein